MHVLRHLAQQPRLRRTAMPHPRPGRSLLAALVHACQEARRSSPERTAPASAGSRSFRTGKAHQPGRLGTPRGSRARTDHMSRSSPATCRAAAGPRCPVRDPVLIAHHFTSASPAQPVRGPGLPRRPGQPPINTERPLPCPDTGAPRKDSGGPLPSAHPPPCDKPTGQC
jgi:hypothetical protein